MFLFSFVLVVENVSFFLSCQFSLLSIFYLTMIMLTMSD